MFIVLIVAFLGVVGKVTVEEDLPAALEGWSSPATLHAKESGDWDQALGEWMSEATFARLKTRSFSC